MIYLLRNSVKIYADGLKLNGPVGTGIVWEPVVIAQSIRLLDDCSIFQAVVVAVQYAEGIIGDGRAPSGTLSYFLIASQLSRL